MQGADKNPPPARKKGKIMTYEDILNQIQDSGLMGQFSQYDLDTAKRDPSFGATMLSYKKDWNAATDDAARQAINQKAEALRKQYGSYYGGSDGSKYYGLGQTPGSYQSAYQDRLDGVLAGLEKGTSYQDQISQTLARMNGYGDFSYGAAPTYSNRYQQQLDEMLGKVQNYGPFSWSKEEDPSYSAYAKQYRREGDRATANALAQAAAATGGQVSTAAMTAASQAGDYYAGQLADKIPELYENAYQRYLSEYSKLADQLGQTQRAEQYDYAKYLDQLGQYNTDRAMSYDQWLQGYNMLSGNLSAMQNQDNAEWSRRLDTLGALQGQDGTAYSRYLDQVNYNSQMEALEREQALAQQNLYQQQLDAILAAGGSPSAGMIAGSGYQNEYVQAMENYYKQQVAAKAANNSSNNSNGNSNDRNSWNIYQTLYDNGARTEGDAYAMLTAMGYNATQANKMAGYFAGIDWNTEAQEVTGGDQTGKTGPRVGYYSDSAIFGIRNTVQVNPDGATYIHVDGMKPMTPEELRQAVNRGEVIETDQNGRYSYEKAKKGSYFSYPGR